LKASVAAQAAITGMRRNMDGSRWVNARQKTIYITGSPFGAKCPIAGTGRNRDRFGQRSPGQRAT
jgi:hypothetical protein